MNQQAVADSLRQPLLRYAARLVGPQRAEDVVQETFLRLLATPCPPAVGRLGSWLFAVCRNVALDLRRKEGRMSPLPLAPSELCPDRQPSPPAVVLQREAVETLLNAVRALPQNQQEVIRLRFQDGFSYREIAGITGLSSGNVGLLIHKAIVTLRGELGDLPGMQAGGALP